MGRLTEAARTAAKELQPGPRCSVGKLRLAISEEVRAELDELLADRAGYTTETIRAALLHEFGGVTPGGAEVPSTYTLHRHRTGKCRCESQ